MATKTGNLSCVETLLQVSQIVSRTTHADIDLLNKNGKSLLHFAVSHNQVEVVAMLCEFAIDLLDWTDKSGNTPLHIAAKYGMVDCMKILLETAADPNILNRRGKTPLALARSRSQRRCVKLLKEYGGSTRGHMPNETGTRKQEMDMDRIMQIWGAFLENAAKAFINNEGQSAQQLARGTAAEKGQATWVASSHWDTATPEITVVDDHHYSAKNSKGIGSGSSGTYRGSKKTRATTSTYRSDDNFAPLYTSEFGSDTIRQSKGGVAKKDPIKIWEAYTDEVTGSLYYWCPETNDTKWTLDDGDFDMGPSPSRRSVLTNPSPSINNFMSPRNSEAITLENEADQEEWTLNFDDASQKYYWWNTRTYDSVWDDSANDTNSTVSVVEYGDNLSTALPVDQEDVWTYHLDEATQRYYWWNARSGESSWADENDDTYGDVVVTGDTSVIDGNAVVVEEEWLECYDENGHLYYFNSITGQSQWPTDAVSIATSTALAVADEEFVDDNVWIYYTDETSGKNYWYNSVSNESVWAD